VTDPRRPGNRSNEPTQPKRAEEARTAQPVSRRATAPRLPAAPPRRPSKEAIPIPQRDDEDATTDFAIPAAPVVDRDRATATRPPPAPAGDYADYERDRATAVAERPGPPGDEPPPSAEALPPGMLIVELEDLEHRSTGAEPAPPRPPPTPPPVPDDPFGGPGVLPLDASVENFPPGARTDPAASQGIEDLPTGVRAAPAPPQGIEDLPTGVHAAPAPPQGIEDLPTGVRAAPAPPQGIEDLPTGVRPAPARAATAAHASRTRLFVLLGILVATASAAVVLRAVNAHTASALPTRAELEMLYPYPFEGVPAKDGKPAIPGASHVQFTLGAFVPCPSAGAQECLRYDFASGDFSGSMVLARVGHGWRRVAP
jgi:hypothetical protein